MASQYPLSLVNYTRFNKSRPFNSPSNLRMADKSNSSSSLEGRVAIVTGSSRGIGREIALHLAEKGAKLVINYAGNVEKAEEVASLINNNKDSNGIRAITSKADVSKAADVVALFDEAERAFGRVDILVNNAGVIDAEYRVIAETPEQVWDWSFNVNCKGSFLCSREAANRLVQGGGGRIISLSSSVVAAPLVGFGAYAASQAAVETMTKILAKELRGTNITANCVAPGPVLTDMFMDGKTPEMLARLTKEYCPLERLAEPHDVAAFVAFLATDKAEWING